MNSFQITQGILHTSLESSAGRLLAEVRLSDRRRFGVMLQAAALLSHLEAVGWRLDSSWDDLKLDDHDLLRSARVEPGPDRRPAQERLESLVVHLFGSRDRVVGKGQAKRLVARFLLQWQQELDRIPADRIVTRMLDEAEFLWQPTFASCRRALVAEARSTRGRSRVLVAGRAAFERRLVASSSGRRGLENLLAHPDAKKAWSIRRWEGAQGLSRQSRLSLAEQLHFRGEWQDSMAALNGLSESPVRILRADCLRWMRKLALAKRELDSALRGEPLSPRDSLAFARVSASLHLDSGNPDLAMSLVAQRSLGVPRHLEEGFDLLTAEVAAQCGDWQVVCRRLSALDGPDRDGSGGWRWCRLKSWWAAAQGDLDLAETYAARALVRGRRSFPRREAADLWQKVAEWRLERDDFLGAERAARHSRRVQEVIDPSAATAISRWLADLRVRQGDLQRVEVLLKTGCLGSSTQELRARIDLVRGLPTKVLEILDPPRNSQRRRLLAARAMGWLGRGAESRELLDGVSDRIGGHLDPEELPALWALAGDWSRAREMAGEDPVGRLWRLVLGNDPIDRKSWKVLTTLNPYRSARLVFDIQILLPAKVPQQWLDKAAKSLRDFGAHSFAERLDRTREGSWRALESYWKRSPREGLDLGELFATAGYFDTRLEWRNGVSTQVLVPGEGGARELRAEKRDGHLVLTAVSMDPVVKALFALAVREFEPDVVAPGGASARVRGILGQSSVLHGALRRLERLAGSNVPVLIQGETGTGKELATRQLHRLSSRTAQPLVTVNCAALSDTLLLSDLFGHVRGAFTGADRDRAGVFESARGGTVLLDEIGDLPLAAQGKLLRVLQEGEVRRVGESLPRQIDVRIVAATHRDLRSMVEKREFRADLFYRLHVGCLNLPALRDREQDVILLAEHFLERSGCALTRGARQRLLSHHWPGNVRELRNVLQVAVAMGDSSIIDCADLELPDAGVNKPLGYHRQVEDFRRDLVCEALAASAGQRSVAARRLALSRQALSYLVRRFGLE
jgi:transcriptional regulator with AAA-type ATPase domain